MQRTDSLEKTLKLGKIEGKRRRGQQRMRRLDDIIDSKEFEQAAGDNEGHRSLACCRPWGCRIRHNLVTERQQHTFRRPCFQIPYHGDQNFNIWIAEGEHTIFNSRQSPGEGSTESNRAKWEADGSLSIQNKGMTEDSVYGCESWLCHFLKLGNLDRLLTLPQLNCLP